MVELFSAVGVAVLGAVVLRALMLGRLNSRERTWVWYGFGAHIASAIAQVAITKYYYGGGDMFLYFKTGTRLAELVASDPFRYLVPLLELIAGGDPHLPLDVIGAGSSTGAMSGLSALFQLPLGPSLYAICIVFGLFALSGQIAMYLAVRPAFPPEYHRRLLLAALFVPSVVFWSSALLKEPLAVAGVGWVALGFRRTALGTPSTRGALLVVCGLLAVAIVKPYILFPLAIALMTWWYWHRSRGRATRRNMLLKYVYLGAAAVMTVGALYYLGERFPKYAIDNVAKETSQLQALYYEQQGAGSTFQYVETSEERQVFNAPLALASALFRPLPFEVHNATSAVNALEMAVILLLFPLILLSRTSRRRLRYLLRSPTTVFMLTFVLILAAATGLGAPNLGSLSRYRIPMMPFYVMLLLVLAPFSPREGPRRPQLTGRLIPWDLVQRKHQDP